MRRHARWGPCFGARDVRNGLLGLLCALGSSACPSTPSPEPQARQSSEPASIEARRAALPSLLDDFEGSPVDASDPAFEILQTGSTSTPARWIVTERDDAPSPPRVFGIATTENQGQIYNVALRRDSSWQNGSVAVSLRADTGVHDRGGGVVFRALDADNYYVARWNPLEENVRFYVVERGHRSALGKTDLKLDANAWHRIEVLVAHQRFELLMDDTSVLIVEDATFAGAGRTGLWTKADAATWFDDFSAHGD